MSRQGGGGAQPHRRAHCGPYACAAKGLFGALPPCAAREWSPDDGKRPPSGPKTPPLSGAGRVSSGRPGPLAAFGSLEPLAEAAQPAGSFAHEAFDRLELVARVEVGFLHDLVHRAARPPAVVPVRAERVFA